MARYDSQYREMELAPQWGRPQPLDPNWRDGDWHGHRMEADHRHGAYGRHRMTHRSDLGFAGGFNGIYDEGDGRYDRQGIFHHPRLEGNPRQAPARQPAPRYTYDQGFRHVENGGVQRDSRFLGQYNRNSVGLRYGGDYRGYGQAPGVRGQGQYAPESARRPTNERGYNGYNRGGFADNGGGGPMDPRK